MSKSIELLEQAVKHAFLDKLGINPSDLEGFSRLSSKQKAEYTKILRKAMIEKLGYSPFDYVRRRKHPKVRQNA